MNKDYWYVGQKVSDQKHGNGEIVGINYSLIYPISVVFKNKSCDYTICGKYDINNSFSSLSPYPHVPIKYNKIFKKGDLVKYKFEGTWYIGIYEGIEEDVHRVNEEFRDEGITKVIRWNYIKDEDILKY